MNPPPARPTIDVDPLARAIDRLLAHPAASILDELTPTAMGELRAARAHLPDTLARMQGSALRALGRELDQAVSKWLRPGGRRRKRAKAKKAPKRLAR